MLTSRVETMGRSVNRNDFFIIVPQNNTRRGLSCLHTVESRVLQQPRIAEHVFSMFTAASVGKGEARATRSPSMCSQMLLNPTHWFLDT